MNPEPALATDSHPAANSASRKPALIDPATLMQKLFWTVPEAAFQLRVSPRTLWRTMADKDSGFPEPRRVRGRTLLARDEVLAFFNLAGGPAGK